MCIDSLNKRQIECDKLSTDYERATFLDDKESLQKNMNTLHSIKDTYQRETTHLKNLIIEDYALVKEKKGETSLISDLKSQIEVTLNSLHSRIFVMDEM